MPLDDENEEVEQNEPEKKAKGGLMKVVLIVVGIIVMVSGSVAATLYFAGVIPGGDEVAVESSDDDKKSKKNDKKKDRAVPIYYIFEKPFVVNFIDKTQIRYLQINVEVMSRDQEVIDGIEAHLPKITNNLLILFSDLDFTTITSVVGKQKLRDLALEELRNILDNEINNDNVEELYFTGFVMQ